MSNAPLPPPIDPVQQTTLEPIRPSGAWYWVGGGIMVVAVAIGVFLFLRGIFGFIGQIDDFERVSVPGEAVMQLDEGEWIVYHEPRGGTSPFGIGQLDVTVEPLDGGPIVPVRSTSTSETYTDGSREGFSVGRFVAPADGEYRISVELSGEFGGFSAGEVAIGRSIFDGVVGWLLGSFAIGAVGVLVGVVIIIVVAVRRGRSKRGRISTSGYRPPPPGQGWPGGSGMAPAPGAPPGSAGAPAAQPPPAQWLPPSPPGSGPFPPAGPSPIS